MLRSSLSRLSLSSSLPCCLSFSSVPDFSSFGVSNSPIPIPNADSFDTRSPVLPSLLARYPASFAPIFSSLSPRRQSMLDHPNVRFLPSPTFNYVLLGTQFNFGQSAHGLLPDLHTFMRQLNPHLCGIQLDYHRISRIKRFLWLEEAARERQIALTPEIETALNSDLAKVYRYCQEQYMPFFALDCERPGPIERRWVVLKDRLFASKGRETIPEKLREKATKLSSIDWSRVDYAEANEILTIYEHLFPSYKRLHFDSRIPHFYRNIKSAQNQYLKNRILDPNNKPLMCLVMAIPYVDLMIQHIEQVLIKGEKK